MNACALEIEQMAQSFGYAHARRLHALSGHLIDGSELAEVYHDQFAQAATATQSGPDFARPEWQEAIAKAGSEAAAAHYAARRDSSRMLSRDDDSRSSRNGRRKFSPDDRAAFREWSARCCRGGSLRRMVKHARECLIAHWSLSGSRTWHAALVDDLARLATLAKVARGASFGEIGEYGDFNSSAARRSFQRLAARMASGDLGITDNPEQAERAINAWKRALPSVS